MATEPVEVPTERYVILMNMKEKTVWFCSNCGNEYPKWMGRCPACGEWNTMVEQKVVTGGSRKSTVADTVPGASRKPQKLNDIDSRSEASWKALLY